MLLYRSIAAPIRSLMRVMGWRVLVTGAEHLPDGPAVLVSNHVSYLDPIHLGHVVDGQGRMPHFLAKRELFDHRAMGPLLRRLRQVPVDRGADRGSSVDVASQLLAQGEWVVVFPEGTISTSFVPADPRSGAARIALAAGAPIVPVALWGGQRIATKNRPRHLTTRDVVLATRIGPPVSCEPDEEPRAVMTRAWEAVTELVDAAQRTYPHRPTDGEDPWWLPRHLGGTAPSEAEAAELRRAEAEERRARRGQTG